MDRLELIIMLVTLNGALLRALRTDVGFFPAVREPWRQLCVITLAMIVGPALDAGIHSAPILTALATGFAGAAPTIASLLVSAFKSPGPTISAVMCMALGLGLGGCAGSLDSARGDGLKMRLGAAPMPPSSRCMSLDSAHRTWGGVGKAAAFGAGAAGVATIPVTDRNGRIALASGAVALGTMAAVAVWEAEDFASAWARECQ